jgi:hypothetical protein
MKKILPALAVALIAGFAASSSAQAAVHIIDFGASVVSGGGGTLKVSGGDVGTSSFFDFDGTKLDVTMVGPDDNTGLLLSTAVVLKPTEIMYGSGTGPNDLGAAIEKTWTIGGDLYTETLTKVTSIIRGDGSITVNLTGTVSDMMGIFVDTPAKMQLGATQTGGPGTAISVSFSDFAKTSTIPEPSTWVMLSLGFVGLGYAATRRGKANRAALLV